MDQAELLAWARNYAALLRNDPTTATAVAGAEFLERQAAGLFASQARETATNGVAMRRIGQSDSRQRHVIAGLLESWAEFVEAGLAAALPFEALARFEAATDLMEQVQGLLAERDIHPAAPVVLAGAGLEEALRAMFVGCTENIQGSPSIAKYAAALRKCDRITRQDEKNITAWAVLRNSAAHGNFGEVSREDARIMAAGINLFIQQRGPT